MQRVVELDDIALLAQHVELHLHLRRQQRQQVVETVHAATAEDKFMEFGKVVAMLIYIDLQSCIKRMYCQFVVVGKSNNVIAEPFVDLVHVAWPILALVQQAFNTCMCVQIAFLPAMSEIDITVWIVDVGTGERLGLWEIIYEAAACSHKNHQHNEKHCV